MAAEDPEFEVALSFAGEDREYVRDVRDKLVTLGRRVFYDEDRLSEMWGTDLPEYLDSVYRERARFAVAFISQHYVAKAWPRHEKRSALARALEEKGPYLLPVRLDDVPVPGLPSTVGCIDARRTGIDQLVKLIVEKLDGSPSVGGRLAWDGRTPRSREHIEQLLREKPVGWEYLLYAGTFRVGVESRGLKYRDHELRFARRSSQRLDAAEAVAYVPAALDRARAMVTPIERLFEKSAQERAFGLPGVAGDPERITHLAERILTVYEDLMDWAADLRGITVPAAYEELFEVLAETVDEPIEEFRQFVVDVSEMADQIAVHAAKPEPKEPLELEVTLKLTIGQHAVDRVTAAIKHLPPRG